MNKYLFLAALAVLSAPLAGQSESEDLLPEWTFTTGIEGAAHDGQGNVYACNFARQGTIGIVREGQGELFAELPEGSVGNGIVFDAAGDMYIADYTGHNILRIRKGERTPEVFVHHPAMNQPNDLAISPSTGILYASDPDWKNARGQVWMVRPDGTVSLLEGDMGTTNGIEVSPDGRRLYVNESAQRKVWVYDIRPDGTVENKRLFRQFEDFGMDGMRCDSNGRLWLTRHEKGTVAIFSPQGRLVAEVPLTGKKCSNITLMEQEKEMVGYITMADRGCFEVIYVNKHQLAF